MITWEDGALQSNARNEPGVLTPADESVAGLGEDGRRAWAGRVDACVAQAAALEPKSPWVVHPPDVRLNETTVVDWTGLPLRVASCLPRDDGLALLDWQGTSGCEGRQRLQEEYMEWRVVRDQDGGVRRVEFTTEMADFWRVLAAHAPAEALRVAARFAGEPSLPPAALFGPTDPFAAGVSPDDREAAFAATLLDGPGPYNSGERSMCCMVHPSNTLQALVKLLSAAAFSFVAGERGGCAPAWQTIPLLSGAAEDGRGSDPVIVERLGRLAFERRLIGIADPVGMFIVGVEHSRLRRPDGRPVPPEWLTFGRGIAAGETADGRARYRRLVLEVPPGEGLRVSDLVDTATEQPIAFGGQVADLVQLAVFLRVSAPGALQAHPRQCEPVPHPGDALRCAGVRDAWEDFCAAGAAR